MRNLVSLNGKRGGRRRNGMSRVLNKVKEFALANAISLPHAYKHFSFLVERNTVICWGVNKPYKTHPLSLKYGNKFSRIHSELSVITSFPRAPRYLQNCNLINVRVRADGCIGMAKPCKFCSKMLQVFRVAGVWYTNDCGMFEEL